MALVNFILAFVCESLIVDYFVFHKLKMTKLYKKLDSNKPKFKEINQQTRNNIDWLKDALDSSVGFVNRGFDTVNQNADHSIGIDLNNTNSNISLISNDNSTVDLISRGYESDLNQDSKKLNDKQHNSKTNSNLNDESNVVFSSSSSPIIIDNRKPSNSHIVNDENVHDDAHKKIDKI